MKKIVSYFLLTFIVSSFSFAQKTAPENWFNLDMKKDKFPGVSSNRAYDELLKNKPSKTVIVAVIDGGTDIKHEDLKDNVWVNEKEIAGNGIDDDRNGYVDDINGWSFISGKDSDVVEDTYELTRMYAMLKPKYERADTNRLDPTSKKEYDLYQKVKKEYLAKYNESTKMFELISGISHAIKNVEMQLGTESPTLEQIKAFKPSGSLEALAKKNLELFKKRGLSMTVMNEQLRQGSEHYEKGLKYGYNVNFNTRLIVGDNYSDPYECCYGSNRVSGPRGEHGTHVAGIIGAVRNNGTGINGVASNVRIMVLRVVPDGDERDKDIANAIRYAAANGASIINMSFGKDYSPYKVVVDSAVKFAVSKDVLIIHAAGNDSKNTEVENNFPRAQYINNTGNAETWIEVGASSWQKKKKITAPFSNYGKTNVDLFAPGVDIYSTLPGNTYGSYDGTSMAAPVTAGVAAIIRSYYPRLSAKEVRDVLLTSVTPVKRRVCIPGEKRKKTKMKELCETGGIVNAYNAVLLAEERSKPTASR